MKKNKIPLKKVQKAFSSAIRRRDCRCMIKDYEPCSGALECSHFFTQGGNPSLMFYPANAYAQCQRHHFNHHHKKEPFYMNWLMSMHEADFLEMQSLRHCFIKYTDELKAEIIKLCNEDRLNELQSLLKRELQNDK